MLWADGRWVDSTPMSVLAREWAVHRGGMSGADTRRGTP
ncbi:hypothetical protein HNQ79_003543 [Streptomyces candidus]|uniref:Uncharacterized protein n=1 Tax=Streptomyces candidus TaxID=67283 RepID=A0A7X0LPZ6_9ACTN|nr:hypothetical protein [Streptomyces candidus]